MEREEGWGREIATMEKMRRAAQELGGTTGVERQKAQGKKTARERIDMVSSCTIISLVYVLYVGGGGGGGGEARADHRRVRQNVRERRAAAWRCGGVKRSREWGREAGRRVEG